MFTSHTLAVIYFAAGGVFVSPAVAMYLLSERFRRITGNELYAACGRRFSPPQQAAVCTAAILLAMLTWPYGVYLLTRPHD